MEITLEIIVYALSMDTTLYTNISMDGEHPLQYRQPFDAYSWLYGCFSESTQLGRSAKDCGTADGQ